MFVSRLYIINYRSIRELDLRFTKGKNIIIGRNNCGKSNIIRALHIVLGETSPTYHKSDNVTLGDFHSWKEKRGDEVVPHSADELFIWCELTREQGEALDYNELYKCFGFSLAADQYRDPIRFRAMTLPENYGEIFDTTEDTIPWKLYINPKLRNQASFEKWFEDKHSFAFAFKATKDKNDQIEKDIRFLFRESYRHDWLLAFKASVRTELLQSAIIPSFRDPQSQLRLTSWTWYGKLMQHLTAGHMRSPELQAALNSVREVADEIFVSVREQVSQSALDIAFPGTELYFQFNADNQLDLYKTCVLYVDDGFKSLLTDKGSGIQSAVVIGLFSYYTKYVNVATSALLCIEEPEIYLHPVKFWHHLNPDAFPIESSEVDRMLRLGSYRCQVDRYLKLLNKFRTFVLSRQDWLPHLWEADGKVDGEVNGKPVCSDNKLWDKMCMGLKNLDDLGK